MRLSLPRPLLAALILAACSPLPDTVGDTAPSRTTWRLAQVNGAEATYPATLRLLDDGRVIGAAPCGRFTAQQGAPLPFVDFSAFTSEVGSCDRLTEQQAFFTTLQAMDFAEVGGTSLRLTNGRGQSMDFAAAEGPNT
ncbi:META domain-containing protein [Halovulum sp. GXIMD14794]